MTYRKPETIDHWTVFTKRMFTEWDSDPGYAVIQHSGIPRDQQMRFAIAWASYYNLGIAARASELKGAKFWAYLHVIYTTAQRGSERRHFRGAAGLRALKEWSDRWPKPETMMVFMCGGYGGAGSYFDIRKRTKEVYLYGDYLTWKVTDLHEVLGFGPLDMTGSEKYSPKTPQQGAHLIHNMDEADMRNWSIATIPSDYPADVVSITYAEIARYGRIWKIPPRTTNRRPFGIQEAETVCCVYKQMSNGSYTYGTRTAKAVRRLRSVKSDSADAMITTLLRLSPYTEEQLNVRLDSLTEK